MKMKSLTLMHDKRIEKAADNMPPMRQGERSTSDGVKTLQIALVELDYLSFTSASFRRTGMPDGIFGIETRNAVTEFQRDNRLKADGIAGRQTLVLMDDMLVALDNPIVPQSPAAQGGQLGNRMLARRLRLMA